MYIITIIIIYISMVSIFSTTSVIPYLLFNLMLPPLPPWSVTFWPRKQRFKIKGCIFLPFDYFFSLHFEIVYYPIWNLFSLLSLFLSRKFILSLYCYPVCPSYNIFKLISLSLFLYLPTFLSLSPHLYLFFFSSRIQYSLPFPHYISLVFLYICYEFSFHNWTLIAWPLGW